MLKNPQITEAIEQRNQDRLDRIELDQDWVLRRLMSVVERCMQVEAVLDAEGKKAGEYRFQATLAIRALELLGKHTGLWPADGAAHPPAPDEEQAPYEAGNPELANVIRLFRNRGKS